MIGAKLLSGVIAGCLATAPMTIVMELLHQRLPRHERYPLPPSEITTELTEEVGLRKQLNAEQHLALTLVNHFAYGAAAGGLYAVSAGRLPVTPIVKGVAFGLLVWSVSYLGLLPALGILRPATQHPAGRNLLMIAAHVVWGSATGVLTKRLDARG